MKKTTLVPMIAAILLLSSGSSQATQGNWTITQSTTLTEDHVGTITLGADNIFLDCANHQVIFDATAPWAFNCTNVSPMTCGIVASRRQSPVIRNCKVQGGFGAGIYLITTHFGLVSNTIISSAHTGLYAQSGDHIRFDFVTARYNTGPGFYVIFITDSIQADNLVAAYNGGTGIYVGNNSSFNQAQSLNLIRSTSTANTGTGLWLSYLIGGLIQENNIIQNGGHGINVSKSQSLQFTNNSSYGNGSGCDAIQDYMTGNGWTGNFFSQTCPTVPSPH